MKIIIISDSHANTTLSDFVNKTKADFFLHCGDLSLYSEFTRPVYFIKGNHEDFNILEALTKGTIEFKNLRYIKNNEVITLEKDGEIVRVLGFGGNYSPKYFHSKPSQLHGERRRHFTAEVLKEACIRTNIDILLTHEAPLELVTFGTELANFDVGRAEISMLIETIRPKYAFSGHHHKFRENLTSYPRTKAYSVPRFLYGYLTLDTKTDKVVVGDLNVPRKILS